MMDAIYTYQINGMTVQTGDIICTMNGKPDILPGEFWRLVGRLVPGDVDHVAIYLGPDGRCAEAGARGVITFNVPNGEWDTERMARQRGLLFDTFYGVASPLDVLGYSQEEEERLRMAIAKYALAQVGKPYNLNFLNTETEEAFYCSQLAYKAYQTIGIDLNTGLSMEQLPGTNQIVYPQEIWDGFSHRQAELRLVTAPA
ncbi:MAG TPA: YiiX/YebB-like N1pC/P60 family cysteine hydrolase [Anaerolineales bacterium]|nr:YiiX/YebB-like N1pC/P60 family cysteine hydrolase [Anaerolineales bacterium]HRK89010.1 YiiX/YebB-like N1pC/P60 family cysteine hydrolase [Anaerolineales bacterium]